MCTGAAIEKTVDGLWLKPLQEEVLEEDILDGAYFAFRYSYFRAIEFYRWTMGAVTSRSGHRRSHRWGPT